MCVFDQVGDICYGKIVVVNLDDVKIGMQCCEGIIGDFGFGCGDCCQKGGFVCIWKVDKIGIGDQFQMQLDLFFFVFKVWIGFVWCLVD